MNGFPIKAIIVAPDKSKYAVWLASVPEKGYEFGIFLRLTDGTEIRKKYRVEEVWYPAEPVPQAPVSSERMIVVHVVER